MDAFAWPKLLLILVATGDTDGFETFATDGFEGFAAALAFGRRGSVLLVGGFCMPHQASVALAYFRAKRAFDDDSLVETC